MNYKYKLLKELVEAINELEKNPKSYAHNEDVFQIAIALVKLMEREKAPV